MCISVDCAHPIIVRRPGPLCGSIPAQPNWPITPGHLVAAMVAAAHEVEQRWILGSVVGNDGTTYIVEDIMEESDALSQKPAKKERSVHNLETPIRDSSH